MDFLDTFRGFAIAAVFLFHALSLAFWFDGVPWRGLVRSFAVPPTYFPLLPLSFGYLGVAVFFVISGFCIHLSFRRHEAAGFAPFFLRRFFRIYPPYLLALAVAVALGIPTWHRLFDVRLWDELWPHLLLVHNLSAERILSVNPSLWSLATEAQLYAIYPLLVWSVRRWGWSRWLGFTAVLEVALGLVCGAKELQAGGESSCFHVGQPFKYWFSWSIGAGLAEAFLGRIPYPRWLPRLRVVLAVMLGCYLFRPLVNLLFPLAALGTAVVLARCLREPDYLEKIPRTIRQHLTVTGPVSYSLYLIHQPLLLEVWPLLTRWGLRPHALVVFALACGLWFPMRAASRWMYRWVELPSMAWGSQWARRWFR